MNPRIGHFGQLVRERRTASGITLGDVASALSCSISYVSDVEHGRRNPFDNNQISKLADLLKCSAQELMRAAAKDMKAVKISSDREEVIDLAACIAWFVTVSDDARLVRLRRYLDDEENKDSSGRKSRPAVDCSCQVGATPDS